VAVIPEIGADVQAALGDLAVTLHVPAPEEPRGIAWFVAGMRTAIATVGETTAAMLWPCRFVWVDPETVTSLVEAHGAAPQAIVRPAYAGQSGFPILIPVALIERLAAVSGMNGEDAVSALVATGVTTRQIELGDPGIVHDLATPRADLPRYQGPPEPAGGPPPEWNSALATRAADAPR
jgi:CTP:molybdopterin cytidylyltransferase MocA